MFSILDNSKRYYPSPTEQAILINGTRYYFSQPERSPKRNIITKKYSNEFSPFNPHWNHRAVRLWFNNNKSLYIANNNNNILANTKLQQITISLKEKIVSNNIIQKNIKNHNNCSSKSIQMINNQNNEVSNDQHSSWSNDQDNECSYNQENECSNDQNSSWSNDRNSSWSNGQSNESYNCRLNDIHLVPIATQTAFDVKDQITLARESLQAIRQKRKVAAETYSKNPFKLLDKQ